jgi:hypothetical protein
VAAPTRGVPLTRKQLMARAAVGAVIAWVVGLATMAALEALRSYRAKKGFDFGHQLAGILTPQNLGAWTTFVGVGLLALTVALMVAATLAARRGLVAPVSPPGAIPPDVA